MHTRKYFIFLILALIIVTGVFIFTHGVNLTPQKTTAVPPAPVSKTVEPAIHAEASIFLSSSPITTTATAIVKIEGESYPISVSLNETVIDAMLALREAGTITFTSKEYPPLGTSIDSINGVKNGNNGFWIFSINGVESSKGVSSAAINPGDSIEWKYENNY